MRTATFLFAAGQETTARLLAAALKHLAEHPELQDELRADREQIPDFLEEVLRVESPVKTDFRLARRTTTVGGVDITAGTPVMLLNGAANRDPRRFECPARVPHRPAQRPGPHRLRARRPLVPRRPAGPGRGPGQPRAHPRPDARHPPVRGAPRPARRAPLRLRADVDPPRPHQRCTSSSTPVEARVDEPRRRRHRRRVGHRPRRRPAVRRRRPPRRPPRPQRRRRARRPPTSSRADGGTALGGRGRRRRPGVGRRGVRRRSAPSSARSRSSSPAPASSRSTPLARHHARDWDRIIAVNLTGTFTCVQAAVPDMVAAGWGRIVTISSSSAQSGAPNMAHYAASKGGVIALTKALAVELARSGITANTIPPSLVDTPMARHAEAAGDFPGVDVVGPMVPLGRAGTPDDIAGALLVPVLRRRQLHHRPGHRRQRRHVHLTHSTRRAPGPDPLARGRSLGGEGGEHFVLVEAAGSARRVRAGCRRTSGGRSGTGTAPPSSRR